jgi:hypothetical protein
MPGPGCTAESDLKIDLKSLISALKIYISNKYCSFFKNLEPKSIPMAHYSMKAKNIEEINKY